MTIQTDDELDFLSFEMNVLALDLEESEEVSEESPEESPEEASEESSEEAAEENLEETSLAESSYEVTGEMTVVNFDKFDTPLVDCSAITINLLLVLMFVALATVGGVLNE